MAVTEKMKMGMTISEWEGGLGTVKVIPAKL